MTAPVVKQIVFLLEEPSAQDLLEGLMPRLLPENWHTKFIPFEGKQDLERRMARTLRAWRTPGARFVILRDQDAGDCKIVRSKLIERCKQAGRPDALVRVACRELEAWIVGDLVSFADEFQRPQAARLRNKAKFAKPDAIERPVDALRQFFPEYQKRDGARRMGLRLDPSTNESHSFRAFCEGVRRIVGSES